MGWEQESDHTEEDGEGKGRGAEIKGTSGEAREGLKVTRRTEGPQAGRRLGKSSWTQDQGTTEMHKVHPEDSIFFVWVSVSALPM